MSVSVQMLKATVGDTIASPTGLISALREVEAKREADVIRFRTCCADPRASK